MKRSLLLGLAIITLLTYCNQPINHEEMKKEILDAEKAFERMASEKGIAEAFYHFAAEDAIIKRENDTLIKGRESIKNYYDQYLVENASVNWTPDYIEVSNCGTLGYTYGKYVWKTVNAEGIERQSTGVFHTVWKKQKDNTWKYVWD